VSSCHYVGTNGVRMGSEARSSRLFGVVVGVGIVVLAAFFLLPADDPLPVPAAAVVVATVVVVMLFLPAQRWWRWPVEDRLASIRSVGTAIPVAAAVGIGAVVLATALVLQLHVPEAGLTRHAWRIVGDAGAVPMFVAAGGALTYALRPVTPLAATLWAGRRGLNAESVPAARRDLRRIRTWRTIPAVLGAAIGVAPSLAYNLALDVQGAPPSGAALELLAVENTWPYEPLTLALAGYLLGTVVAELTRRAPAREPGRRAHLETRTPTDYLVPAARWLPRTLAAATVIVTAGERLAGSERTWWSVALALLLVGAVETVQRWVVRRPQRVDPGASLRLDDILRSSAAHGIAGGASALLLIVAADAFGGLVSTLWAGDDGVVGGVVGVITMLVTVVLLAAVWGVWLGFGSAHRGQTPVRDAERVS
jgi:hypothetical protein